jgi:hypothetical protein
VSDVDLAQEPPIEASFVRPIALIAPYIAVSLGLFVAHSAWVAWLGYQLAMLAILSFDRQWHHAPTLVGRQLFWWSAAAAMLTACAGVGVYVLAPLFNVSGTIAARSTAVGLSGGAWLPFIVAVALTNPWLEEVYWRGYLGSGSPGLTPADVWFGGYHVLLVVGFLSPWWFVPVLVVLSAVSWGWRQITRISGGLAVSAMSHLAADVSILLAVWVLAVR